MTQDRTPGTRPEVSLLINTCPTGFSGVLSKRIIKSRLVEGGSVSFGSEHQQGQSHWTCSGRVKVRRQPRRILRSPVVDAKIRRQQRIIPGGVIYVGTLLSCRPSVEESGDVSRQKRIILSGHPEGQSRIRYLLDGTSGGLSRIIQKLAKRIIFRPNLARLTSGLVPGVLTGHILDS